VLALCISVSWACCPIEEKKSLLNYTDGDDSTVAFTRCSEAIKKAARRGESSFGGQDCFGTANLIEKLMGGTVSEKIV